MSIKRTGQFLITGDTEAFTAGASPGSSGSFIPRMVSIMDVINFCDPTLDSHDISFVRIVLVGAGGSGGSAGTAADQDGCIIWGPGGGGGGMIDISGAPGVVVGGAAGLLMPGALTIGSGAMMRSPGQFLLQKGGYTGGDTIWDFNAGTTGYFKAGGGGGGGETLGGAPGSAGGDGGAASGWNGYNELAFLQGSGWQGGQGGTGADSSGGTMPVGNGGGGVSGASLSNNSYPIFYNKQGRASAPPNLAIQNATRILSSNLMMPKYASAHDNTSGLAAAAAASSMAGALAAGLAVPTTGVVRKFATTWVVPSVLPSANTQRDWYVQQVGRGGEGSTSWRAVGGSADSCVFPGPTDPICGGGGAIAVFWTSYH